MEMPQAAQSVVSSCDMTDCTFNREQQCYAGAIQIAMVENMAHCATYTPSDGATGMGSTRISEQTEALPPGSNGPLA